MDKMGFHHKESMLDINKEHYFPSFIAKEIQELRAQKDTRKKLREYKP